MNREVRLSRRAMVRLALIGTNAIIFATGSMGQSTLGHTGTRIEPRHTPPNNSRQVAAEFGACVVKKHRSLAVQWLDAKTREERSKLQPQVFDADCLEKEVEARDEGIELTLPGEIAKFAIAEPLAQDALGTVDPSVLTKAPRLTYLAPDAASFAIDGNKRPTQKQIADAEKARQEATLDVAFEVYGECVVRQSPSRAKQLLMSPVSSADETAAFGALMPAFSECLPKGQEFAATKAMLRGTVALAYYRLAKAAKG